MGPFPKLGDLLDGSGRVAPRDLLEDHSRVHSARFAEETELVSCDRVLRLEAGGMACCLCFPSRLPFQD